MAEHFCPSMASSQLVLTPSGVRYTQHVAIGVAEPSYSYCTARCGQDAEFVLSEVSVDIEVTPVSRKALTVDGTSGTQNPRMVCSCGKKSATVEIRTVIPPTLKTDARLSSCTIASPTCHDRMPWCGRGFECK